MLQLCLIRGNRLSGKLSETYLKSLKHQKGHPPTEKSKEITETKLYKKVAKQVIQGALNNPLSQYCLVCIAQILCLKINRQRRFEHIIN